MERQMMLYIRFLPYCENDTQLFKLLDEIQFLKFKVQQIDRMPTRKACEVLKTITEKIQSND